jgi:hypothetical protein
LSEGARSGRDWEEYFDYLQKQFHAGKDSDEFKKILCICKRIVFNHDPEKPNEVEEDSDGDSAPDIDWGMQALQLSDDDGYSDPNFYNNNNDNDDLRPDAGTSMLTPLPSVGSSRTSGLPVQSIQPTTRTGAMRPLSLITEEQITLPATNSSSELSELLDEDHCTTHVPPQTKKNTKKKSTISMPTVQPVPKKIGKKIQALNMATPAPLDAPTSDHGKSALFLCLLC